MKGSTLHRSGLTRENMSVLAGLSQPDKKQATRAQLNRYYKATKAQEIDLLWGGIQKSMQKVRSVTKNTQQKSPLAYLTIGFIAGVLFMSCIILIVSISSMTVRTPKIKTETSVAVIGEELNHGAESNITTTEEKYIVKKGDTLNGIAYRFYGRYNEAKILEIQRINGITNPTSIRIGQELIIPVTQER